MLQETLNALLNVFMHLIILNVFKHQDRLPRDCADWKTSQKGGRTSSSPEQRLCYLDARNPSLDEASLVISTHQR